MMSKFHHFFFLKPSAYPLIISLTSFNMFFTILLFFKYSTQTNMVAAVLMSMLTTFMWWINYSNEMSLEGFYSKILSQGLKMAMILFIYSEILFFFSFFWSYFHFFLAPQMELGLNWPPVMTMFFKYENTPLINTMLLLSSGVTITISHHYNLKSKKKNSQLFLMSTMFLGVLFTILQKVEYSNSFFSMSDSTFGTTFFMLTGFHGLHVMIGSMFLLVSFIRSQKLISSQSECLNFEMASWYWHFVDVVWILLYFMVYYLNN